ncbi:MAG: hypothetical protein NTV19_19485 [Burkholderiales bacterium]|nr:hypothetical protein [Burkholderiales bacterium]
MRTRVPLRALTVMVRVDVSVIDRVATATPLALVSELATRSVAPVSLVPKSTS